MSEFDELLTQQRQTFQSFLDYPTDWSAPLAESIWNSFFPQAESFIGDEFMDEVKESVRDGLASELRIHTEEHIERALFRKIMFPCIQAIQEFIPAAKFTAQQSIDGLLEERMEALETWMQEIMDKALMDALPSIADLLETTFIHLFKSEDEKMERMEKDFQEHARRLKQAIYARKDIIILKLRHELSIILTETCESYTAWLGAIAHEPQLPKA